MLKEVSVRLNSPVKIVAKQLSKDEGKALSEYKRSGGHATLEKHWDGCNPWTSSKLNVAPNSSVEVVAKAAKEAGFGQFLYPAWKHGYSVYGCTVGEENTTSWTNEWYDKWTVVNDPAAAPARSFDL
jgi:hypothetical protein